MIVFFEFLWYSDCVGDYCFFNFVCGSIVWFGNFDFGLCGRDFCVVFCGFKLEIDFCGCGFFGGFYFDNVVFFDVWLLENVGNDIDWFWERFVWCGLLYYLIEDCDWFGWVVW